MTSGADGRDPCVSAQASDDARIYEAVREITEQRICIEQAEGRLVFTYGIDADAAFDLLRWQSQQHNVELRLLAEQIVKDVSKLARSQPLQSRLDHDGVHVTAHQRIASVADRQRDGQSTPMHSHSEGWVAQLAEGVHPGMRLTQALGGSDKSHQGRLHRADADG